MHNNATRGLTSWLTQLTQGAAVGVVLCCRAAVACSFDLEKAGEASSVAISSAVSEIYNLPEEGRRLSKVLQLFGNDESEQVEAVHLCRVARQDFPTCIFRLGELGLPVVLPAYRDQIGNAQYIGLLPLHRGKMKLLAALESGAPFLSVHGQFVAFSAAKYHWPIVPDFHAKAEHHHPVSLAEFSIYTI